MSLYFGNKPKSITTPTPVRIQVLNALLPAIHEVAKEEIWNLGQMSMKVMCNDGQEPNLVDILEVNVNA